jgi:hypothetical protein
VYVMEMNFNLILMDCDVGVCSQTIWHDGQCSEFESREKGLPVTCRNGTGEEG